MREIKFRAWDKEENKWAFYSSLVITLDGGICFKPRHSPVEDHLPQNDRFILVQFTGLLDKNGKEIYEGDIIHCECDMPFTCLIEFDKEHARFCETTLREDKSKMGQSGMLKGVPEKHYEILGNIYENPELLKDKP